MNNLKHCQSKEGDNTVCSTKLISITAENRDPTALILTKSAYESNFESLLLNILKVTPLNVPRTVNNLIRTGENAEQFLIADLRYKFGLSGLKEGPTIEAVAARYLVLLDQLILNNYVQYDGKHPLKADQIKGFFPQHIYVNSALIKINSDSEKIWKKLLKNFQHNKSLLRVFGQQLVGSKTIATFREDIKEEQKKLDQEEISLVQNKLILKNQKLNFDQLNNVERLQAAKEIFNRTLTHLIDFIFEKLPFSPNNDSNLLYSNLVEHSSQVKNLPTTSKAEIQAFIENLSKLYQDHLANQTFFNNQSEVSLSEINNFQQEFLLTQLNLFEEFFNIDPNILRKTIQYFMDQCFMTTLDFFFAMHVGKTDNLCQNQDSENCQAGQPKDHSRFNPSESLALLLQFFWEDLSLTNPEFTTLNNQDLANNPIFIAKITELKNSESELAETPFNLIVKYLQAISSDPKLISAPPQSLQKNILFEGFEELHQKWLKIKAGLGKRYNFTEKLIDEICDLFLKPELNQIISQSQAELLLNLLNQILDKCNLTDPTKLQLSNEDKLYLAQLCKKISYSANLFSQPASSLVVNLLTELSRLEILINSHHQEEAEAKIEFQQLQYTQDQIDRAKDEAQLIDQQLLNQTVKIECLQQTIQRTIQDNRSKPFSILQIVIEQLEEIQQLIAVKDKIQQDLHNNNKNLSELEKTLQQELEGINPQRISDLSEEQTQLNTRIQTLTSSINQITAQIKTLLPLSN